MRESWALKMNDAFELLLELVDLRVQRKVVLGEWPTMTLDEIEKRIREIKSELTDDGR